MGTDEEGGNSLRRVRDRLRLVKTRARRFIDSRVARYKRRPSEEQVPREKEDDTQLSTSSSIHDESTIRSDSVQPEEDLPPTALYAQENHQKPMDVSDAEQIIGESEKILKLERDLSDCHHQIVGLQKRCEAQSRDLEISNSYLNAADKSSDTDVVRALHKLNAEVQQIATHMAECLAEDLAFTNVTTDLTKERMPAASRAVDYIGQVLVTSLGTATPEDLPMLLQIAFQAYLAFALCRTTSSWTCESGNNTFINEIYQRLREAGEVPNVRVPGFS